MGILHIDTLVTHREPTGNPQGTHREGTGKLIGTWEAAK